MKNHKLFLQNLEEAMRLGLPGWDAHRLMAPLTRLDRSQYKSKLHAAKKGGVLLLLYPEITGLHTILIKRTHYEGVHSGQISMPGGKQEPVDKTIVHTALRESQEEVNIHPDRVNIVGALSQLYIPPSNFLVFPVLGFSDNRPEFKPEKKEVRQIIEVPLSQLLDPANVKEKMVKLSGGARVKTPYYDISGHVVWGATAMILSEFIQIVKSWQ